MTSTVAEHTKVLKGGSFILEDHDSLEVFTPEDLSDEHRMIAQTAREFTEKEVMPLDAEIESKNYKVTRDLLTKAGELGLLSIDIPEKYGGAGLDLLSSLVASEHLSGQASFSGSVGAHTTATPRITCGWRKDRDGLKFSRYARIAGPGGAGLKWRANP